MTEEKLLFASKNSPRGFDPIFASAGVFAPARSNGRDATRAGAARHVGQCYDVTPPVWGDTHVMGRREEGWSGGCGVGLVRAAGCGSL